jgi:hypothetical protein
MRLSLVALHFASPFDHLRGGPIAGEGIRRMTSEALTRFAAGTLLKILIFRPIQG